MRNYFRIFVAINTSTISKQYINMKFTVSSSAVSSRLNTLSKVIAGKNSLPILDCFLFQVSNNQLTITASDSSNMMQAIVELTEWDGEGEFALPHRTMLDAMKELPEQPLNFEVDMDTMAMKVNYQNGMYNFTAQRADEYPRPQHVSDAASTITLSSQILIDNINRSLFATANDELRPVMNGIYFDFTPDSLTMVASDGHKLVRCQDFTIKSEVPTAFIMPKKPAMLLRNTLDKDGGDVEVRFDDRGAELKYEGGQLSCRLIEGRYPNYNSVIPENNPNSATIDRASLASALRRVLPFADESSQLIRFHLEQGRIELSSEDIQFATAAKEQLACDYQGHPMSIGFKGGTLQEVLANLEGEQIIMQLADPSRAGIIIPAQQPENEDILMLIMPMLLND